MREELRWWWSGEDSGEVTCSVEAEHPAGTGTVCKRLLVSDS